MVIIMKSFLNGKVFGRLKNNITLRHKEGMQLPHVIITFLIIWFTSSTALAEFRSIDGTNNNPTHSEYGSAGTQLLRLAKSDYSDGISSLAGPHREGARMISNITSKQVGLIPNTMGVSDFVWQWGQFLDHDIDLTTEAIPHEPYPIPVPTGDPYFDPTSSGDQVMFFIRSDFDESTGMKKKNPRQQLNQISAFIDASNVYGSDPIRADALRTMDGMGKLRTTVGGKYLPYNTEGLPNAGGSDPSLYLAGDVRANEQIALTAMHTLFVREHNRNCDQISTEYPGLSGDEIYQQARRVVGALMQVITYKEFIPVVLGPDAIPAYGGYDPTVNPGISNVFSTAAYRFGHSMIPPTLLRINPDGNQVQNIALKDAFFNPHLQIINGGIESIFRGLASQYAQEVDTQIVDGLRNFLFGDPGQGGIDLAALNIQRGRDHGLPDYNTVRKAFGLKRVKSFEEITFDVDTQTALEAAYGEVVDMDPWVGGLAEDHLPAALVGKTFYAILVDQFTRLRDGDRFWYQNGNQFTTEQLVEIEGTTLADIIHRNTNLDGEIQDNVFMVDEQTSR